MFNSFFQWYNYPYFCLGKVILKAISHTNIIKLKEALFAKTLWWTIQTLFPYIPSSYRVVALIKERTRKYDISPWFIVNKKIFLKQFYIMQSQFLLSFVWKLLNLNIICDRMTMDSRQNCKKGHVQIDCYCEANKSQ